MSGRKQYYRPDPQMRGVRLSDERDRRRAGRAAAAVGVMILLYGAVVLWGMSRL